MEKGEGIITTIIRGKGYGFITQSDGSSIFFHVDGLLNQAFEDLRLGHEVTYLIDDSPRGKRAIGIKLT